jgi:D-alanyl-D-alanine carboxypeptidase
MSIIFRYRVILLLGLTLAISGQLWAQLTVSTRSRIDAAVQKILASTSAPSVSLAVVSGNQIAYVKAYGDGRLQPLTPANTAMRYPIGSVSKQFLACAMLLLAEDGKLSLSDSVGRYLPSLTQANDVTIRELLSHTSGYEDYYPLDYVAPFMLHPVTPDDILNRFAKKPLNFQPGTEWQYSNTNYAIAGRILEKVTGAPLMTFLRARIFEPLGMRSAVDLDHQILTASDAAGYTRFGLGPARAARPEARGWLFSAGELAMTAHDLAVWDQSLLEGKLLKPSSLMEMIRAVPLTNGAPTNYGLGVGVSSANGFPRLQHGGAVSGFVSFNEVWLDQGAAVAVLTNLDGSPAAYDVANKIGPLLIAQQEDPQAQPQLAQARLIFSQIQQGRVDRSLLTSDASFYFTPQVLEDARASLGPLGTPSSFEQTHHGLRGGMTFREFQIKFPSGKSLHLTTFSMTNGKFAEFLIQ